MTSSVEHKCVESKVSTNVPQASEFGLCTFSALRRWSQGRAQDLAQWA
jgi:hypothetical protein